MSEAGAAMAREINEGPAAIAAAVKGAADVPLLRPRGVIIFGRGTSDHAAIYGRYLIEAVAGVPVVLGAPSLATMYRAPTDLNDWLAIGVSQSGRTREIVACLGWARERGAKTMGITNDPQSALAEEADASLNLGCGEELAVAATKTFIAECAALAALGYGWSDQSPDWDAVVRAGETALAVPLDQGIVELLSGVDVLAVLARGFRFPIALEVALKLMEACQLWAVGMSWADLLHGPITAVPKGSSCLLLDDNQLSEPSRAFRQRLESAEARVVVSAPVGREDGVDDALLPLLEAITLQRTILVAARRRGLDPDHPAGLTKVTQT